MEGQRLTPEEFAAKMRSLFPAEGYDEEIAHSLADDLLCDVLRALGFGEGVEAFRAAHKWYA